MKIMNMRKIKDKKKTFPSLMMVTQTRLLMRMM
jgi:hypothetical protein